MPPLQSGFGILGGSEHLVVEVVGLKVLGWEAKRTGGSGLNPKPEVVKDN